MILYVIWLKLIYIVIHKYKQNVEVYSYVGIYMNMHTQY